MKRINKMGHNKYLHLYPYDLKELIHNPDNYIAMALSYANLGMNEEAIATAEKIKEFGGTYLQQAEEFIAKIRNGTFIKEADR